MRFRYPLALCLLANLASAPGLLASDEPQVERKRLIQRVQEQLEVAIADAKHFRELEAPKWAEEAEERAQQLKKRLKELSQDQSEEKEKTYKDANSRKDPPPEKGRKKEDVAAKPTKDATAERVEQWIASTRAMQTRLQRQSQRLRDGGQRQEGDRMAERVAKSMELTEQVAALTEMINQLAKSERPEEAQAVRKKREALMQEVKEILAPITQPKSGNPDAEARRQELEQLERKLMEVRRNGPPEAIRDIEMAMEKLRHGQREHDAGPNQERRRQLAEELEVLRNKLRQPPSNEEEKRRYQGAEARVAELENLLRQMEHGPGHAEMNPRHSRVIERIEHLRAAANHLKQAEAHDIAQELMHRSDQMQRELEASMKQGPEGRPHPGPLGELHRQLQQMREENEILKREVQKLLTQLKNKLQQRRDEHGQYESYT
ncbi:MAG: hypothetical protein ACK56Q_18040, partial [Pirellulaceae bacterium]